MSDFQEPIYQTGGHTEAGAPRWVGLAVAVLGGVAPGDSLVVKGPESLHDGDRVEIRQ